MKRDLEKYRANAAVVVFNARGKVLICHRAGEIGDHCWQFPQGGIDKGEKPLQAAYRELFEETGIERKYTEKIGKIKGWLAYDFPEDVNFAPNKRKHWLGQKQKWFAMRFLGKGEHIKLDMHQPPEFDQWMWADLAQVPQMTIYWKRDVYHQVVCEFSRFT